jgi:hypothetical protein
MAQDLTTSSGSRLLPAVDVADPASMLLLPDWLASQIGAVSDLGAGRTVLDTATGQITKRVATIPRSKMPTGAQRAAIERRISELRRADRPGPEAEILAHVGDLILEYATARMDAQQVDAKAGAYLDVLSGVPAWAVREAIVRWRCGPVGVDEQALDFAPRPHRLKAMAERVAMVARGQAARLQRILDAEPEEELSEADLKANSDRMAGLLSDLSKRDPEPVAVVDEATRAKARAHLAELEARKAKRLAAEAGTSEVSA